MLYIFSDLKETRQICDHHTFKGADIADVTLITFGNADMWGVVINFNRSECKFPFFTLIWAVKS